MEMGNLLDMVRTGKKNREDDLAYGDGITTLSSLKVNNITPDTERNYYPARMRKG